MNRRLLVLPAAASDLDEARRWYEERSEGLGRDFILEVDQTLVRISHSPHAHAVGYRMVRQAQVDRFPYVVSYRITDDSIDVLAVLHGGRDPRVWRSRA
jgi:plasmid stabilization system protein ParE